VSSVDSTPVMTTTTMMITVFSSIR